MKKEDSNDEEKDEKKEGNVYYLTIGVMKIPLREKDLSIMKWAVLVFAVVAGLTIFMEDGITTEDEGDEFAASIDNGNTEEANGEEGTYVSDGSEYSESTEDNSGADYALQFNNLGILAGTSPLYVNSVTYEAMVYFSSFNKNNTIIGREGVLMLRVGDEDAGVNCNALQIANENFHMEATQTQALLNTDEWYHLAFSYDSSTGYAHLYIDFEEVAKAYWGQQAFEIGGDGTGEYGGQGLYIGKVYGFQWGERPFDGFMKEVRVWSTVRTPEQLAANYQAVDPSTYGLEVYYKMDGSDLYDNVIKDATGNRDGEFK